jgi:putative solute:sodium symporter small subunit
MERRDEGYQVNLLRPKQGYMQDEVIVIIFILLGWGSVTFGFQLLLSLFGPTTGLGSLLTHFTFFTLPFHFWFTGQFLPLWFIILCIFFNWYIDGLTHRHSRKRDRTYE